MVEEISEQGDMTSDTNDSNCIHNMGNPLIVITCTIHVFTRFVPQGYYYFLANNQGCNPSNSVALWKCLRATIILFLPSTTINLLYNIKQS